MIRADEIETLAVEPVPDDTGTASVEVADSSAPEPVVAVDDSLRDELHELGDKVDYLESGVRALSSGSSADEGDENVESANSAVILLDDGQWSEVREAWGWCKSGFSLALFLLVVSTLMVSAMLGTRLWDAFSEGWRR